MRFSPLPHLTRCRSSFRLIRGVIPSSAIPKTMNIKLDKRSEALLKEMLRKNSRYGSVDLMLNEATTMFYASEKKRDFG